MAIDSPKEPVGLTRATMHLGMRVMIPDGTMRGIIISITENTFKVLFDNTKESMEYAWKSARFLVSEE